VFHYVQKPRNPFAIAVLHPIVPPFLSHLYHPCHRYYSVRLALAPVATVVMSCWRFHQGCDCLVVAVVLRVAVSSQLLPPSSLYRHYCRVAFVVAVIASLSHLKPPPPLNRYLLLLLSLGGCRRRGHHLVAVTLTAIALLRCVAFPTATAVTSPFPSPPFHFRCCRDMHIEQVGGGAASKFARTFA
jgi:hypothetical protein